MISSAREQRTRVLITGMGETKSNIGHSMGAAGTVEVIACALTIRDQKIHPTANLETPDRA
jgi:3-oxoacyl-(acyl-carrier-protein) synthase